MDEDRMDGLRGLAAREAQGEPEEVRKPSRAERQVLAAAASCEKYRDLVARYPDLQPLAKAGLL